MVIQASKSSGSLTLEGNSNGSKLAADTGLMVSLANHWKKKDQLWEKLLQLGNAPTLAASTNNLIALGVRARVCERMLGRRVEEKLLPLTLTLGVLRAVLYKHDGCHLPAQTTSLLWIINRSYNIDYLEGGCIFQCCMGQTGRVIMDYPQFTSRMYWFQSPRTLYQIFIPLASNTICELEFILCTCLAL